MENRDIFLRAGGRHFQYVPALNDRPEHARFLSSRLPGIARGGHVDRPKPPTATAQLAEAASAKSPTTMLGRFHEMDQPRRISVRRWNSTSGSGSLRPPRRYLAPSLRRCHRRPCLPRATPEAGSTPHRNLRTPRDRGLRPRTRANGHQPSMVTSGPRSSTKSDFAIPSASRSGAGGADLLALRPVCARAVPLRRISRFEHAGRPTSSRLAASGRRSDSMRASSNRSPIPICPCRGEGLGLALHRPQFCAEPLLAFRDPTMPERIARLRELARRPLEPPPRGLDARGNVLLRAPEGTALLLLQDATAMNRPRPRANDPP